MTHICVFMLSGMSGMSMCVCQLRAGCSAIHPPLPVVLHAYHCPSENSQFHMFKTDLTSTAEHLKIPETTQSNVFTPYRMLSCQKVSSYKKDTKSVVCHCSVFVQLCLSDKPAVKQKGINYVMPKSMFGIWAYKQCNSRRSVVLISPFSSFNVTQ